MSIKGIILLHLAALTSAKTIHKAPIYDFVTRPELRIPRLLVDSYNVSATAPGYIFMSPFSPEVPPEDPWDGINYQFGPVIYDNRGELVWTGANLTHKMLGTMGHFVCDYEGEPHLCFSHYVKDNPIHSDILNSSYDLVQSLWPTGQSDGLELTPDLHEFNMIRGSNASVSDLPDNVHRNDTAILSSDVIREVTPMSFEGCDSEPATFIRSSVFQEVALDGTNEVLFQWDSFHHVPVRDAVECPGYDDVYLDGLSDWSPFDYFHMNSVDKDANGDYLLSARHTSSIYKISGTNGTILWQIGLLHSDFELSSEVPGIECEFAFQHDIRFESEYPGYDLANGKMVVSLYDNANEDYDFSGSIERFSSGKIILIDEQARTAVLKEAYTLFLDDKHQLATNQGSFQLLPNGNRLIGGGNVQEVIEWRPGNMQPVFRAHWGDWEEEDGAPGHKINSYRSLRFEWSAKPRTLPDVFAYAPNCSASNMWAYASWNGATEVTSWTFLGAVSPEGPWRRVGSAARTGFESSGVAPFANYVRAVAHDASFRVLGSSKPVRVAVPSSPAAAAVGDCTDARCARGFNYTKNAALECPPTDPLKALDGPQIAFSVDDEAALSQYCDPCFGTS